MAENLRVTSFNDGTPIATSDPPNKDITGNLIVTYQWITMWDSTLLENLGRVYSHGVVTHPLKNVCPEGWRVPAKQDWITLIQFLGAGGLTLYEGHVLMEENSPYWEPKTSPLFEDPNNESGFTARGGGIRPTTADPWAKYKQTAHFKMSDTPTGFSIEHDGSIARVHGRSTPIGHIRCIME